MSELFKLENKETVDNEKRWTYSCLFTFTFKKWTITKITITDHPWRKKGREMITKELILAILQSKINGLQRLKPLPNTYLLWGRNVYRFETNYRKEKYRLFFWFKDGTNNHLWIRNCHPC